MLKELLRAINQSGVVSTAELARRIGMDENLIRHALRDLERRGYLESESSEPVRDDCAPACTACPIMPKCFSAGWRLTEKSQNFLAVE